MNEDLQALHDALLAQHQALHDKLGQTTDLALAQTIVTEMQEILHRIDLVQGLLFKQTTNELKDSLKKVDAADAQLTAALASAQNAAAIVGGISKFLSVVDQAIDLAKTLAAAG